MALTREYIRKLAKESDVELPKEFIDGIVSEHITARDAYADEQVKTALASNKPEPQQVNVKETQAYKDLEKQFTDYKADIEAKETKAAKDKAYREILKKTGVGESHIDLILKATNLDEIDLDKDGSIKDEDKHKGIIEKEYSRYIDHYEERGAQVATPPANNGGSVMTKEKIYEMKDGRYVLSASQRQAELAKLYQKEKGE